jgi:hypothetical protein
MTVVSTRKINSYVANFVNDISSLGDSRVPTQSTDTQSTEFVLNSSECDQVRSFAGFVTKIRHNHLWEDLPFTRLLISHYNIQTWIFSAHCQTFQGAVKRGRLSRQQKTSLFASTMNGLFADPCVRNRYPALLDVLLHESVSHELNNAPALDGGMTCHDSLKDESVTRLSGRVRCLEFDYLPHAVMLALNHGNMCFEKSSFDRRQFVYWKSPLQQLSIFAVDPITFCLVSLLQVDIKASSSSLKLALANRLSVELTTDDVDDCLSQLCSIGLIGYVSDQANSEAQ